MLADVKANRAARVRRVERKAAPPRTSAKPAPSRQASEHATTAAVSPDALLPDVLQRARLQNAPISSAEVGALHGMLGNQAVGRLARASSAPAPVADAGQGLSIQRLLIQRSWTSDRVDWVSKAIEEGNWAKAEPPGAYYVLNGLSTSDMTNILRTLGGEARAKLYQHLETDGKGFGQARIHMCLFKADWPADSPYQSLSDDLQAALASGNYAENDHSAFAILERAASYWRTQLIKGLHMSQRYQLQEHEAEGAKLKNDKLGTTFPGFTTSELHRATGTLFPGDVAFIEDRQFVIYADEVRELGSGSVAWVTRNPGAMRKGEFAGAFPGKFYTTREAGRFAIFPTEEKGWNAIIMNLQGLSKGRTILQTMEEYAPKTDPGNNPALYAQIVADALKLKPNSPTAGLTHEDFETWAKAIRKTEKSEEGLRYALDDRRLPEELREMLMPPSRTGPKGPTP